MFVPNSKLNIRKGTFSMTAPPIWNQFPTAIKYSENIDALRKTKLKTVVFEIAFAQKLYCVQGDAI